MKSLIYRLAAVLFFLLPCLPLQVNAQAAEIQQLLLNVEKLSQLKSILSDMESGYALLHQGYNSVSDIARGSYELHEAFLDGLLSVSPAVRHYNRVADIITTQQQLLAEYQQALRRFRQEAGFSPGERDYLARVYSRLFRQSMHHLDELTLLLTAGELRMGDGERVAAIDRLYAAMQDKLDFLRHFNRQVSLLAIRRAKAQQDLRTLQRLYPSR